MQVIQDLGKSDLRAIKLKNREWSTMKTETFNVLFDREDDLYMAECPEVGILNESEMVE